MVDSYDLIEWANEFLRQAEQEKIKTPEKFRIYRIYY